MQKKLYEELHSGMVNIPRFKKTGNELVDARELLGNMNISIVNNNEDTYTVLLDEWDKSESTPDNSGVIKYINKKSHAVLAIYQDPFHLENAQTFIIDLSDQKAIN